jgi:tetratricopeptide (TPR) repeat protein
MSLLSDACCALNDVHRMALLYDALAPHADVTVVAGIGALCLGSAARYLGKLAAGCGRLDEANRHFEQALKINQALESPVLVAHTQLDWAAALDAGPRAQRMIDEAAVTSEQLGLATLARRVARMRGK